MQKINENKWVLCQKVSNINQMLKLRVDIDNLIASEVYPNLLVVKHQYTTSDDVLFPELSTLSYFAAFEDKCLTQLEDNKSIVSVASDINEGMIQFYIYCKDEQKTIMDCIEFFKGNPDFIIEFEVRKDIKWNNFKVMKTKI
jgi:hypothetical protein